MQNAKFRQSNNSYNRYGRGLSAKNLTKEIIHTASNVTVIGLDSVNDYYDVSLKEYRLNEIENLAKRKEWPQLEIYQGKSCGQGAYRYNFQRIYSKDSCKSCFAQAGVRYSITNPDAYIESNIIGFYNILEACRNYPVEHLVYASSSSVYGGNTKVPFSTDDKVDNPVSLYAATKNQMSLWHMHTQSFITFHQQVFVFYSLRTCGTS